MPTKRPSEGEIRSQLCTANRILAHEGILNGFGHVTARVPEESRMLVSVAQSPILVGGEDIVSVSLDGEVAGNDEREMYTELPLHLAIYRHRPDVDCVVHHHAPEIMPFACTDCEIRPMGKVGRTFADGVPRFADYDLEQRGRLVVGRNESDRMAINLGDHSAQLLDGHGANVVGSTIKSAVFRTVRLVQNAEYQRHAMALADPELFVEPVQPGSNSVDASTANRLWDHLVEKRA